MTRMRIFKNQIFSNTMMFALISMLYVLSANSLHAAELVLEAGFNGPAPTGSKGLVQKGGVGELVAFDAESVSYTSQEMIPGSGGHMVVTANSPKRFFNGLSVAPNDLPNTGLGPALNTWHQSAQGSGDVLNGALHFFYRQSVTDPSIKLDFSHFMRFGTINNAAGLTGCGINFLHSGKAFELYLLRYIDGKLSAIAATKSKPYTIENDTIYHIAIVAEPGTGMNVGKTRLLVYIKPGASAIDPQVDQPFVKTAYGQVDPEGKIDRAFSQTSRYFLGTRPIWNPKGWASVTNQKHPKQVGAQFEFDRLRIYAGIPEKFEALVIE